MYQYYVLKNVGSMAVLYYRIVARSKANMHKCVYNVVSITYNYPSHHPHCFELVYIQMVEITEAVYYPFIHTILVYMESENKLMKL